jgi:hypothetical protein
MLPDFVRVKKRRWRWFSRTLREKAERLTPLLNHVRTVQQHEGRRVQYDTVDGTRDVIAYDKKTSASLKVSLDEIAGMDNSQYSARAEAMAKDIATQQMQQFFATVDETCQKAGTATHIGGRPFDPMMLVEALANVDVDFDERGQPQLPTLVTSPKNQPIFDEKLAEAERSPEFQRRWNELMQQKWMAWRDREADRKLVG